MSAPPPTPSKEPRPLHTWQCWRCGRIIARVHLLPGCEVRIKCKCGATNVAGLDEKRAAS